MAHILTIDNSNALLYSTCRIVARPATGDESIGTGFFFSYPAGDGRALQALVTNKHVVRDSTTFDLWFHLAADDGTRPVRPSGRTHGFRIQMLDQGWFDHPSDGVDLCATPIEPLRAEAERRGKNLFLATLSTEHLPSQESLSELFALEMVTMVGYPIGLWDEVNNFPLLRRGTTASHPAVDFQGEKEGVVDIAAFPGSSGSPILLVNEGGYSTREGWVMGSRILLLGILYGGPVFRADGEVEIVEVPTSRTALLGLEMQTHLGYYIKAEELLPLGDVLRGASANQ